MKNPKLQSKKQKQADAKGSVYDYIMERTLLADIIIYPKNFVKVANIVKVDDFHLPAHRLIYQAIHNVMHTPHKVDITAVMHEVYRLDPDGLTDAIRIVGDITAHGHAVSNAEAHAEAVHRLSVLRHLEVHYQEVFERCLDPNEDAQEIVQASIEKEYDLIQDFTKKGMVSVKQSAQEIIDILKDEQKGKFVPQGLLVGFKEFDFATGGLRPGDLIVIAAMTGAGKSAFAMNIAQYIARQGKAVAVFSLEMSTLNLADRLVFSESRVSRDKRKHRSLSTEEYDQAIAGAQTVGDQPIYIDDTAPLQLSELLVKIQQAKMQYNVECVIVDYIQLVTNTELGANRDERVGAISRTLKLIAKNVGIPIIALAQINRKFTEREGYEGKKPGIGDIRESGSIENDADIITFLYRPEIFKIHEINNTSTRNRAIGIMAKVRNGTPGEFDMRFNKEYTLFEDLQPGERTICSEPIQIYDDYSDIGQATASDSSDISDENFKELDPNEF